MNTQHMNGLLYWSFDRAKCTLNHLHTRASNGCERADCVGNNDYFVEYSKITFKIDLMTLIAVFMIKLSLFQTSAQSLVG